MGLLPTAEEKERKPHMVCIPFPAQSHINPMLNLAKLVYQRGFHITFVNTEGNHSGILRSRGPDSLNGLPDFRFHTIPNPQLPPPDIVSTQYIAALSESTVKTCLDPFRNLLFQVNATGGVPPITSIISDGCMSFTIDAAETLGIPVVLFWTTSACGYLAYMHYQLLTEKGPTPDLKGMYLDTVIDRIPGMKDIRFKDLPSFTHQNDILLNFFNREARRSYKATAVVVNSFHALEKDAMDALSTVLPRVYSIGPLHFLLNEIQNENLKAIGSNLWIEEPEYLQWLNSKDPGSVVFVNFGSTTVMTAEQFIEFAWGLANGDHTFLLIRRHGLLTTGLPSQFDFEFKTQTEGRAMSVTWCPQEKVLNYPAIVGFLTHGGWNSPLESISGDVPIICWPYLLSND